jgi:hypothetical protein
MIPKLTLNDSYDFGVQPNNIVGHTKLGLDQDYLKKIASSNIFGDLSGLTIPKNHTAVHIIALGDEETFGPNRNADGFSRKDCINNHHYFKDIGHLFMNHKNNDPIHSVGNVLASGYNDQASRVELIVALDNNKCRSQVQDLASGKDLAFSMGSSVAHDVCSYCGHKAPTADKHCDHVKNYLNEVLDDGTKIYMKNPDPKFFDISIVHKPADRVAYMLKKLSNHETVPGHELAQAYGLEKWSSAKFAMAHKLALMKKTTYGKGSAANLSTDSCTKLKKMAADCGLGKVLTSLHQSGFLLSPRDFADVVVGHDSPENCEDKTSINELMDDHTEISSLDGNGCGCHDFDSDLHNELSQKNLMTPQSAAKRTIVIIIPGQAKLAKPVDKHEQAGLSYLYAQYKLAFALHNEERPDIIKTLATTF